MEIYLGHKNIWVLVAYIPILKNTSLYEFTGSGWGCIREHWCLELWRSFFWGSLMGVRQFELCQNRQGSLGNIIPRDHWMKIHHDSRHLRLWKNPEIETENGHKWLSAMLKDHLANPDIIRSKIYYNIFRVSKWAEPQESHNGSSRDSTRTDVSIAKWNQNHDPTSWVFWQHDAILKNQIWKI